MDEPRSFADTKEVHLDCAEEIHFWTERLGATPEEIAEAVSKVGCNRTALEIYLGVASAGPSRPSEDDPAQP